MKQEALLELCTKWSIGDEGPKIQRFLQLVTDKSVDLNRVNSKKQTTLILLCKYNQNKSLYNCIRTLLDQGAVDFNLTDEEGWDAIMFLCKNYRDESLYETIFFLFNNGSKLTTVSKDGWTPLLALFSKYCEYQFLHTVRFLLSDRCVALIG